MLFNSRSWVQDCSLIVGRYWASSLYSFLIFKQHRHYYNSFHHVSLIEVFKGANENDEKEHIVSREIVYNLLQGCLAKKDLALGRHIRCLMVSSGLDFVAPLGDHLICTLALCGSLLEAESVFLKISKPSIFTWNAILFSHVSLGERRNVLLLYAKMQHEGSQPDGVTFLHVLKACGSTQDLIRGRYVHSQIVDSLVSFDAAIGNSLVDMYAKCGSIGFFCSF
ncbi:hypothetical protein KP509_04G112700 [Ceratopteris richardii]|uniref:Pentatricopeptide repeat-containing protein n=1 Tax=Ceratopteris richardii TaxID=49495 RepID=A0A8T2V0Q1_CERRI|nr:hypothetical protein KP509_04G112700 [Ceratopteris richardii]